MTAVAEQQKEQRADSSIRAYGPARATVTGSPLTPDELRAIDAYWRASLYLSLGMLYLKENPLLHEPLQVKHTKPRLLGHWGSDAGQSFTYIHFNRLINKYDLNAIFISGPGHGAPAVLSNAYLEALRAIAGEPATLIGMRFDRPVVGYGGKTIAAPETVARGRADIDACRRADHGQADHRAGQQRADRRPQGGGWFAARPSGTESIYKIYAESFKDRAHLDAIVTEAQAIVSTALGASAPSR